MITKCPSCGVKMRVDPSNLEGGSARVMCPKCKNLFEVKAPATPAKPKPEKTTPPAASGPKPELGNVPIPDDLPGMDPPQDSLFTRNDYSDDDGGAFGKAGLDLGDGDDEGSIFDTEESALLDLALTDSGYTEPAEEFEEEAGFMVDPEISRRANEARVRGLNVREDARRRREQERTGTIAGGLLVVVLTLMGLTAFVASRNDWILDFKEIDQMLGVAFKGQSYVPRHVQTIRLEMIDGRWVEETIEGVVDLDEADLEVVDLDTGHYRNEAGSRWIVVNGALENHTDADYFRQPYVRVQLVDPDGQVAATLDVPAGEPVEQPALESLADAAALSAHYDGIASRAAELDVPPTYRTPFTAVFPDTAVDADVEYSVSARALSASIRTPSSCWSEVRFDGDTADNPDEG